MEPLADQEIGIALTSGVVQCQVKDANLFDYADIAAGTAEYLQAVELGGAQILWSAGSGTAWAIVRLPGLGAAMVEAPTLEVVTAITWTAATCTLTVTKKCIRVLEKPAGVAGCTP